MSRDTDPRTDPRALSVNVGPTHSPEGVDLTLIEWMLSLTPLERLLVLQSTINAIEELRAANTD